MGIAVVQPEFKMKIVPKATEICFSSALITVIAAMALPPHMAVPAPIKKDVFLSILNYT
jgi:hypothetical protein